MADQRAPNHENKARADELRKAATDLQIDTWADLLEGPIETRVGNAQRIVDWLRERANNIEKHNTEGDTK